ncbi:MAG: hypothetical protein JRJ29_09910 [Deltaproteobacteria bacterium]|nr:hypothetical protein [Deltaproteobacteria bacterium]
MRWKFFSLRIVNKGRRIRKDFKIVQEIGLRALRVAAAVRREFGNAGVERLYTVMGTLYHHDHGDMDELSVMEEILRTCKYPAELAKALKDRSLDLEIEGDMAQAMDKVGKDVGVPLIVLEGGKGEGFFGPVMSPAPRGKKAVAVWEALITLGGTPGFFELKRRRDTGPVFGPRPRIRFQKGS